MFSTGFLTIERVSLQQRVRSKKRALEEVSKLFIRTLQEKTQDDIFDSLLERERLGSTGVGQGIALPHARISGVDEALGTLIVLQEGADYDALDRKPVDIIFGLLVPEEATNEHLEILAKLATLLDDVDFCNRLRNAKDEGQLLQVFHKTQPMLESA